MSCILAATASVNKRHHGFELPKLLLELNVLARTGHFVGTFSSNCKVDASGVMCYWAYAVVLYLRVQ